MRSARPRRACSGFGITSLVFEKPHMIVSSTDASVGSIVACPCAPRANLLSYPTLGPFVIRREGQTLYKGTFKADPAPTPAPIDFQHTEGELNGKAWLGIYALEGDTLRIADNAPDMTKPRLELTRLGGCRIVAGES